MSPWYRPRYADSPAAADYLISYLSERQRNFHVKEMQPFINTEPAFVAELDGRVYARVYPVRGH